ncbi:MAG TPA: low molecular weight protein-tyrosine-phosphatase [Actinomycetaceae bacterium]|nr:low molecular weight protein-tyrosine-phosphatase [Actinomycetaceae bacterium]
MKETVNVLVVCTGNICRSPMGEQLLREVFDGDAGVVVDSAGVSSEEQGNPVDRRANAALRKGGHGTIRHTARRVRRDDFENSDLILAMTSRHYRTLRRWAQDAGVDPDKVRMWREFDPSMPELGDGVSESDLDVDDPWYGVASDFDRTLEELEAGLDGIQEHVRELRA